MTEYTKELDAVKAVLISRGLDKYLNFPASIDEVASAVIRAVNDARSGIIREGLDKWIMPSSQVKTELGKDD